MNNPEKLFDAVIVGGGMVGAAAALGLAQQGLPKGGAVGFVLWSAGWLALAGRLLRCAACSGGARERFQARVLPALLLAGIVYVLVYGIGDFPDSVIRASLFHFIGLGLALTQPRPEGA